MLVAFTPGASAETRRSIDVHQACVNNYGVIIGTTHGSTADSWRCKVYWTNGMITYWGVDLNSYYCHWYGYGTAHWDVNRWDAWYCRQ